MEDLIQRAIEDNILKDYIIDYYNGQDDIKNKIIRCVNPTAFIEDPLRVMRMARFAATLGFNVDIETLKLSQKINISSLTQERMLGEIIKALDSKNSGMFFETLLSTGHLNHFFPEMVKLVGVEQVHHTEDAFEHILLTLKEADNKRLKAKEKFALLLHDLGKGETPKEELPKHHSHDDRSYQIAKKVCDRWKVSDEYKRLAVWFAQEHMRLHNIDIMSYGKRIKFAEEILKNHFEVKTIISMSECDSQGRYEVDWNKLTNAIDVVKVTKADDIVAKGFTGKKVGDLLHEKRVESLKKLENQKV